MKFTFTSQNIVKSHKFFEIIANLERKNYIMILKNHRTSEYRLTDKSRMVVNELCKDYDTDKQYLFLATRRFIEW